jgi:PAS domain S-box-containing protein
MGFLASNRARFLASFLLATAAIVLGLMLSTPDWRPGEAFLQNSYDSLHSLSGPRFDAISESPVVIVYLDFHAFDNLKQDPAIPWPRDLHAKLLHRLTQAGAKAVVFDIVFSQPGPSSEADNAFANAIRQNGRVILAAEFSRYSFATENRTARAILGKSQPPYLQFANVAAAWGIAVQAIDEDNLVRRYAAGFPSSSQASLTWATANWLHLPRTQAQDSMRTANSHWVRYYGPPLTIPHIGYSDAFDLSAIGDDFFRDKIVFIGARPVVEKFNKTGDEFRNPFHSSQYKQLFMPGVEVHATEMLNLLRSDWLRRLTAVQESSLLLLGGIIFGAGLIWLRPVPATALAAVGSASTLLLALVGFSRGVWFPWLIISAAQIPTALGGSILFYSIEWYRARLRFIAAKRRDEAKIREQAELIDKAHDAIIVQDLEGRILHANRSAQKLYGWSLAELQFDGAPKPLFLLDPCTAASARSAALTNGEWNGELRLQSRNGQIIIVDSRWTLIRDDDGRPKALLLINSDITEKKQLEAQFLRTQRMNTIGTLAGGMAHDLNNALAPVLMGVQLLRRKTSDDESSKLLSLVEANTHRGADMVRQVLLFARGRGLDFESIHLGALVQELERMVRETFPKTITVESFVAADLWHVRANVTQLHQVLLNLCVNSRDAMPDGGRLSFAADNVELSPEEAASIPEARPGQYVSLLVSDTGMGIPPEVRSRIFEPFFTTKPEGQGSGIGLATVMRIIKSHGGFLRLQSEPGQGATFEFFLPRAGETPIIPSAPELARFPQGNNELLLVVDDEEAIRNLLADALVGQGYRVLTASNGLEAVQLFRRQPTEIRLLLTDCDMPVMDGHQAIKQIRQICPDLPVIFATGETVIENKLPDRRFFVLVKPFSLTEILSVVHRGLSICERQ